MATITSRSYNMLTHTTNDKGICVIDTDDEILVLDARDNKIYYHNRVRHPNKVFVKNKVRYVHIDGRLTFIMLHDDYMYYVPLRTFVCEYDYVKILDERYDIDVYDLPFDYLDKEYFRRGDRRSMMVDCFN